MPGFVTHYLFGEEIYHQLKCNSQKKNLFYNRSAYAFGLQGPDLFFYYLPSYALHRHNLGALAHTTEPRAFFHGLLESYGRLSSAADRGIAEAYISGFLGHYLLDTTCHPYIYAMTHYHDKKEKSYFSRHAYLETEIDTELLARKRHKTPCEFHASCTMPIITHSPNFPFIVAPCGWESSRFRSACGFFTMKPDKKRFFSGSWRSIFWDTRYFPR